MHSEYLKPFNERFPDSDTCASIESLEELEQLDSDSTYLQELRELIHTPRSSIPRAIEHLKQQRQQAGYLETQGEKNADLIQKSKPVMQAYIYNIEQLLLEMKRKYVLLFFNE